MKKKLLSLLLVFVMLSGAILITPNVSTVLENVQASEDVKEATASSFEAIAVKQVVSDGTTTLTGGYKSGSSALNLNYNYSSAPYHRWLYFKYDISALKDIESIKSAVISIGFNWNKNNGTLYVKALEESVWNDAVAAIAAVKEDATTVIDSTKFVYPKNDTTADTLGTVKRSYGNTANNAEAAYRLTGNKYTQSYETTLTGSSKYRTATFAEGPLLKYVQDAVQNDEDYIYFSVCYYSTASNASDRYGSYRFYTSANSIKASNDVMVVYNNVAGNKFNANVTTLDRATDFTYSAVVATKDTNVRLLAAIYGKYNALSKVIISDVLSSNNGNLSLTVPLSSYPDATSVKCFVWDGDTLRPYAEPKVTPVKTELQEQYSGKKVIFIGDSNVYWGRAVEARSSKNKLSERQNDHGIFYQICKANGLDVSVTNWTYGSHGWWALFDNEECTVNDTCGGINHEEELTDRNYDYVFLGLTRSETDESKLDEYMTHITGLFREANPNVQIIVLAPSMIYGISDTGTVRQGTIAALRTMEEKYNVKIADWGRIVRDILEGNVTVPGTNQEWVKNTFVVKDKKHVNLLGGYMTALMSYCVFTGEKAEGQNYDFFKDSSVINVQGYADTYYTNGDSDTNFPEILASETEMLGIQKLIDKYIEEKAYLTEY